MIPDIKLKDFYLQFVSEAKTDIIKYKEKLNTTNEVIEDVYIYIEDKVNILKDYFNLDLNKYPTEWIEKKYNPKNTLYGRCIKILSTIGNHPNRVDLLQVVKYCKLLENKYKHEKMIALANNRANLKLVDYRRYITNYYNKVHKCVLQGMGYKFSYGIGTFICNHWKLDPQLMKRKPKLDYNATALKKKELIAKGIKVYDDKEAAWYQARKIPYDGVDYRVYRNNTDWYEFVFIKSQIAKAGRFDFHRTKYTATKYRGMTYADMAEQLCHNEEDIYNLQVDLRSKLNILLYKDPTKYLNYVRNAEQYKYKRRAHNSKD